MSVQHSKIQQCQEIAVCEAPLISRQPSAIPQPGTDRTGAVQYQAAPWLGCTCEVRNMTAPYRVSDQMVKKYLESI